MSISKVSDPIELISIDRETIKTVPVGTNIISLFVFLDAGAFGATELQNAICKYFIDRFDERILDGGGVVMVKAIRLVKVGPIKLGSFNET